MPRIIFIPHAGGQFTTLDARGSTMDFIDAACITPDATAGRDPLAATSLHIATCHLRNHMHQRQHQHQHQHQHQV
ncbi:hypothetical protein E4U54_001001 [Claviceps lovelessii]|nr:hypothetical protein E4U54_001001 [Claviceps lovelessii]